MNTRNSICRVGTVTNTFNSLLLDQLSSTARHYDLTVVTGSSEPALQLPAMSDVEWLQVPMTRGISPHSDWRSIHDLVKLFRKRDFDIVHSITPKAGLLAMTAARAAGVPIRHHTFTGQVWETLSGIRRWPLIASDALTAGLATQVYCDSISQMQQLESAGVVRRGACSVLGSGSVSGVPSRSPSEGDTSLDIRKQLELPDDSTLIVYVGRLSRDKGIDRLLDALELMVTERKALLLAGRFDERDPISPQVRSRLERDSRVHLLGFVSDPLALMKQCDIFAFASHREGFGTALIEAGAAGLPVVAMKATGVVDAVVNGSTGILCDAGDLPSMSAALDLLASEPELRQWLGSEGRQRAKDHFGESRLTSLVLAEYEKALHER